jgi:hypothetical protein
MYSIKSADIGRKKKNVSKRIFKSSLALVLIVFAFTMSSQSSFFQIIKPAEAAGTLTNVSILPTSNIVNERATYDIFFKTATTGTIKIIHMSFPSGFDVSAATKLIERSGIGGGILSAPSTTTLIYTVNNPVIVHAGTTIRLEIGRIMNSGTAGSFKVSIATERSTTPIIIDGPTLSTSFPIKDIGTNDIAANSVTGSKITDNSVTGSKITDNSVTGSKIADNSITGQDLSTGFTIRKTLHDDAIGNAHGWNPDISTRAFAILDSDISGLSSSEFVSVMVRSGNPVFCAAASGDTGVFGVYCDSPPGNFAELDYIITKLPAHDDVVSSLSASTSESTPSASPSLSSSPHTPALPDIASINRRDDSASEFP